MSEKRDMLIKLLEGVSEEDIAEVLAHKITEKTLAEIPTPKTPSEYILEFHSKSQVRGGSGICPNCSKPLVVDKIATLISWGVPMTKKQWEVFIQGMPLTPVQTATLADLGVTI